MKRADFANTGFLDVLKLDKVVLPFFSRLTSYLFGSGFESGWIKLSKVCLAPKEKLGVFLNLDVDRIVGLYFIIVFLQCC